jgi:hypothetical protein
VPCEAMRIDGFGNSMNNRRVGELMLVDYSHYHEVPNR